MPAAQLGLSASVGVVGGLLLGVREALLTLDGNAFVQPGQYFWTYVAVPIVAFVLLAVGAMLVCGGIVAWLKPSLTAARSLQLYGGIGGGAGALSIAVPWVIDVGDKLLLMGADPGVGAAVVLWLTTGVSGIGAGLAGSALGLWLGERHPRVLAGATRVTLAVLVLLMWPIGSWLARDFDWVPAPAVTLQAAGDGTNVLLISIDTLRVDPLGGYGAQQGHTPHLDGLAAEGVLFEQAITSSPWTLPAVASLLTGLDPRNHRAGMIRNQRDPLGRSPLPPDTATVASALRARGYRTHAIVTNPYLAPHYGLGVGFESYSNLTIGSEFFLAGARVTALRLLTWIWPALVRGDRGADVSARAVRWLEDEGSRRPFFLWLHYIDPHPPYSGIAEAPHKSFRSDTVLAPRAEGQMDPLRRSPDVARLRSGEIRLGAREKESVRRMYQVEVARVDAAIGQVLDTLDALGLRDRTLVVCVSDHGEEFWEHGGVEHGHTLYDEVLRIPLLMRLPGTLPAGVRIRELVRITDVAPTILDVAGLSNAVPSVDGRSTIPLVRGSAEPARVALSENLLFAEERVSIRTASRKYIRWATGREETYDLDADAGEMRDLTVLPEITQPLRQLLAEIEASEETPTAGMPSTPASTSTAAALRNLGYVQ
jgi:arylsulfatase A-like enzyme